MGSRSRELTWQAVLIAFVVAFVVSASYPYVVLKLGLGPNVSVVSAFLGALLLLVLARRTHGENRLMNNIVQTAGTSAASTAFMCVVAAAVDLAAKNPTMTPEKLNGITEIRPWPMFWWLVSAGGIGVLFTVLFRRHFLDDPRMVFADGVAAAETIAVLDSRGSEAGRKLKALGLAAALSAVVDALREIFEVLPDYFPTALFRSYRVGIEWNFLSIGSGLLIGLKVSLSMLAASLLVLVAGPWLMGAGVGREIAMSSFPPEFRAEAAPLLEGPWDSLTPEEQAFVKEHGGRTAAAYLRQDHFPVVLLWLMWPATALMITSAITAVLLKWRSIVEGFTHLRVRTGDGPREDVSLTTVLVGGILFTVVLAVVQQQNFGMSVTQTVVAVLCSLPLILVGIRVLGETNNGPISVMMNGLQAIFAVFWPGATGHNLIAAGMSGSCNAQGQGTIQDYRTGQIVGSTPRILTWVQLAAVPIGAAAVSIMYPLLKARYEIGGPQLAAPTGLKIANMAILISQGAEAFPRGALLWTVIAAVVGVLLPLAQYFFRWEWLPSAAGFGFGLILPGTLNIPMAIGGILGWLWMRRHPSSHDRYAVTVASGLIAGEALLGGLVMPVLRFLYPG